MNRSPLGDHVDLLSGFAFDSSRFGDSGAIPVVRIRDVVRGYSKTFYSGDYDARFVVRDGDLLIGMDGDFNRGTWSGGPAVLNQRVVKISARPTLDMRYLYHFLPEALARVHGATSFATVKHLSVKAIRSMPIPIPPLPEQRRIAAILDEADALRVTRQTMIHRLDALVGSAFERTFGVPQRDHSVAVGSLLDSAQYGTSAKAGASGEFEILRMGNITASGRLDLSDLKYIDLSEKEVEKFTVRRGDVLFNRTNSADLVGKTVLYAVDRPRAYAGYLVRLRPKSDLDGPFIAGYLNSRHGKAILRGMAKSIVGMANINAKEAQSIRLPVASDLDKLNYANQIEASVRMRDVMQADLSQLDSLFACLQHRAFRGEL